jgi:putative PIN family toxin of toxin-antitoxin system
MALLDGPHELIISAFLLDETARVLRYPRLQARHGLNEEEIEKHLDFLRRISELVDVVIREPIILTDPDDDPVVYTAVDGQADVICTLDRDFFQPNVIAFCQENRIAVMTDVQLLRRIRPVHPSSRQQ